MVLFIVLISVVICQRLAEVVYARHNEKRMKQEGAVEVGASHYKWIVMLHVLFFLSLLFEVLGKGASLGVGWPLFLFVFLVAQGLRVWTLMSLGKFWNTKIIVLPGAKRVTKGPYQWLPHPNYVIVALEIISLPLIFGAWITSFLFTISNALLLLLVRIPAEEKALEKLEQPEEKGISK